MFLILAVRTREYRDEWRWWVAVAAFTGVTLWWSLQFLQVRDLVGRKHPVTVIYLIGVACMGADAFILVLGRVRGVWRFQQPN